LVPVHESSVGQVAANLYRGNADLVEQHAGAWIELSKRTPGDAPFFRPEWIAAYLRAFEPDANLLLATADSDQGLQAILPLVEKESVFCGFPVRVLRGAANEHSCRFDLVRSSGEEGGLAVRAIWDALKACPEWDLIELPYVPENGSAEQLLDEATRDGFLVGQYESYTSPYVTLSDRSSVDELPVSAHFRRNLHRRWRKARENSEVGLKRVDCADPAMLKTFFDLEAAGWKGKEGTAIACSEPTRNFYNEIARVASACGYFSLYLLQFGEIAVAGHFGLSFGQRYYSPKVAYNEAFSEFGPGHLMVDAILRDVHSRDFREFDFLGPWMDWKGEWARAGRIHYSCYIFRPGLFGQSLHAAKLRLFPALRRIAPLRRIVRAVS
jgi:CelD/BcsL family acetyltransferase involved in cellulose biosynthesis